VVAIRSVDETVGVLPEDVAPCVDFVARPTEGRGRYLLDGMVQVCEEAILRAEASLPVPISGFLDLASGLGMEDQTATGHGDCA
jgi:hypothetical protein